MATTPAESAAEAELASTTFAAQPGYDDSPMTTAQLRDTQPSTTTVIEIGATDDADGREV